MYVRFCQFYSHSVFLLIVCGTVAAPLYLHINSATGMTILGNVLELLYICPAIARLDRLLTLGQWSCVILIAHISDLLKSALCIHCEGCALLTVVYTDYIHWCYIWLLCVEADCVSGGAY